MLQYPILMLAHLKSSNQKKGYIEQEVFFSQKNSCPDCGISIPELQPRLFSFNNPYGACPDCTGLGEKMEYDIDLIVPDKSLSFNDGGVAPYNPESEWNRSMFEALAQANKFSLDTPFKELTKKQQSIIRDGTGEEPIHWVYQKQSGEGQSTYNRPWIGVFADMRRRHAEAWGDNMHESLEKYMAHRECNTCHGKKLRPEALGVTIAGKNIWDLTMFSVSESIEFFDKLKLTDRKSVV